MSKSTFCSFSAMEVVVGGEEKSLERLGGTSSPGD